MQIARSCRGTAHRARRLGTAAAALLAGTVIVVTLAGCSTPSGGATRAAGRDSAKYGSLPGFLPSRSLTADSVLTGSVARPALTTEGDAVRFGTGAAAALVTVTGPEVPGEGLPYQAAATTCTWTVTIAAGSAPVATDPANFSTIDHLGAIYHPELVAGQPVPPAIVAAHTSATFELRAVMIVGEGLMRWDPDGRDIVASWDFEVEND